MHIYIYIYMKNYGAGPMVGRYAPRGLQKSLKPRITSYGKFSKFQVCFLRPRPWQFEILDSTDTFVFRIRDAQF